MLTIDDCNTIMEKYGEACFLYEIDFNKIPDKTSGKTYNYDFCEITFSTDSQAGLLATVEIINSLGVHPLYIKNSAGTYISGRYMNLYDAKHFTIDIGNGDLIIGMYISKTDIPDFNINILWYRDYGLILPLSPLQIPVVKGEFDNKFYVDVVGSNISSYTIDGSAVTLQSDDDGYYLELPSATDCIIGTTGSDKSFPLYRVTFHEFKSLPNLSIPSLHKGNPQEVKLYNEDTEEYIADFQAYYNGRKLKDNIVELEDDVEDYVDLVIDILDPAYPPSRVKLKALTTVYTVTSQSELETAINNGIHYLKVVNGGNAVQLNGIELNNITLIDSKLSITNCLLNNIKVILVEAQTILQDKGGNQINNCTFERVNLGFYYKESSAFNNCNIKNTHIEDVKFKFTGRLEHCYLYNVLVISDGDVELIENRFIDWGFRRWPYFPSYLYLTGNYTAKDNNFKLSGTWEEPAFNMCIIKTLEGFNPSQFIADNSFDLNIVIDDEPTDTFYYNIVDDDKIYARRLS